MWTLKNKTTHLRSAERNPNRCRNPPATGHDEASTQWILEVCGWTACAGGRAGPVCIQHSIRRVECSFHKRQDRHPVFNVLVRVQKQCAEFASQRCCSVLLQRKIQLRLTGRIRPCPATCAFKRLPHSGAIKPLRMDVTKDPCEVADNL